LRRHRGDETIRLLLSLVRDKEPAVAAVALGRLVELDSKLVLPFLDIVLANPDANIRSFGVETLLRQPNDAGIRLLGDRLADTNPEVRALARRSLETLAAKPEFRDSVIREGSRVLAGKDWRGLEQATYLLVRLSHKSASARLIELLQTERPEAFIAAAWGLRQFAVHETLEEVHQFVLAEHKKMLNTKLGPTAGRKGVTAVAVDRQLSQLVQFLGQARFRPADKTLRNLLPRVVPGQPGMPPQTPVGIHTKAAAAWALGMIHEGVLDKALSAALVARLTDLPPPPQLGSEFDEVRRMSAISLARIKATDALPSLRRYYAGKQTDDLVNNACGWAIAHLTGTPLPALGVIERSDRKWFMYGLENKP
jgi:HEAT repeat protein